MAGLSCAGGPVDACPGPAQTLPHPTGAAGAGARARAAAHADTCHPCGARVLRCVRELDCPEALGTVLVLVDGARAAVARHKAPLAAGTAGPGALDDALDDAVAQVVAALARPDPGGPDPFDPERWPTEPLDLGQVLALRLCAGVNARLGAPTDAGGPAPGGPAPGDCIAAHYAQESPRVRRLLDQVERDLLLERHGSERAWVVRTWLTVGGPAGHITHRGMAALAEERFGRPLDAGEVARHLARAGARAAALAGDPRRGVGDPGRRLLAALLPGPAAGVPDGVPGDDPDGDLLLPEDLAAFGGVRDGAYGGADGGSYAGAYDDDEEGGGRAG